jgi:hypothetical protein
LGIQNKTPNLFQFNLIFSVISIITIMDKESIERRGEAIRLLQYAGKSLSTYLGVAFQIKHI